MKHGAMEGSDVYMTESAYMTDVAWNLMAESHSQGIRKMPYIKENPQWWALEIFDGYGSHVNNLKALEIREKHKILCVKEEGDSSAVNQAYDKYVAASDKRTFRSCLGLMRTARILTKGVLSQWDLVHVVLSAI